MNKQQQVNEAIRDSQVSRKTVAGSALNRLGDASAVSLSKNPPKEVSRTTFAIKKPSTEKKK